MNVKSFFVRYKNQTGGIVKSYNSMASTSEKPAENSATSSITLSPLTTGAPVVYWYEDITISSVPLSKKFPT